MTWVFYSVNSFHLGTSFRRKETQLHVSSISMSMGTFHIHHSQPTPIFIRHSIVVLFETRLCSLRIDKTLWCQIWFQTRIPVGLMTFRTAMVIRIEMFCFLFCSGQVACVGVSCCWIMCLHVMTFRVYRRASKWLMAAELNLKSRVGERNGKWMSIGVQATNNVASCELQMPFSNLTHLKIPKKRANPFFSSQIQKRFTIETNHEEKY